MSKKEMPDVARKRRLYRIDIVGGRVRVLVNS